MEDKKFCEWKRFLFTEETVGENIDMEYCARGHFSGLLGIIWVYSRKGSSLPSLKNKMFQSCLLVTFSAMLSNILSTLMIYKLSGHTSVDDLGRYHDIFYSDPADGNGLLFSTLFPSSIRTISG